MSQFHDNLNAQRERLGLTVEQVQSAMHERGYSFGYATVAGWFNGHRGLRWKVDELRAVLEILQTSLEAMVGDGELLEDPVLISLARSAQRLTPAQQQAVLAMINAMQPEETRDVK